MLQPLSQMPPQQNETAEESESCNARRLADRVVDVAKGARETLSRPACVSGSCLTFGSLPNFDEEG